MKDEIEGYLKKAADSITSAALNLENGLYDFSVSRSYYAMFYCAEAILLSKGLSYSSHSAVISCFSKEFVKTGIFEKKYFDMLRKAFELRQNGDYEPQPVATKEQAEEMLEKAKEFLEAARRYLGEAK
jgi:uncharacterized protein (UPF0332 family)